MRYEFADPELQRLYTEDVRAARYPVDVIAVFRRRIRHLEGARDERDLRTPKSVHFEQLVGKDAGKCSMRLNRQWRLIVSIREDGKGKRVVIREINNHYGD